MAAGSRDRPSMLIPGRYPQWRSWFLRYVDTRPNGEALRKCILSGPYKPTTVLVHDVKATDDSLAVPEHTIVETPTNMSPENKAHFLAEKEAIHLILNGIGDDIYSTVDACQMAQEMWEAIERLQHGESINIQDVKTNLFWEFRKLTSHDGESMELYYTRFYKLMNEMIRNNLSVTTIQVNIQFLQQLQLEWLRFVMIVKQQHKLDEVSYHKLFDILKQYRNEVNELCAKKLARNANPLALVATAQASQDQYYQTSRSHRSSAPSPKPSIPSRSQIPTRHKGKEIAKSITPPSETTFEEDSDPKQAQRDKDMQKNLALIAKYFKKIYKPTNNNLRTSSNSKNKNMDTTPQYKNDNHSGQFGTQRTVNVAGTREKVGSQVVQKTGIQCFNCKEYGHFAKECKKPKRVKDSAYHKEKMLLCKQAEQGVPLQAEQYDCNTCLVETDDSNVTPDSSNMCEDDIRNEQNDVESDDEQTSRSLRESISVRNSFLVALQTKQAEFEKYKAFNDRTVDYDKLERKLNEALRQIAHKDTVIRGGLKTKAYELSVVKEKHDELMKQSLLTKLHYEEIDELESEKAEFLDMYDVILQECVSKDDMCCYLQSLSNLDALAELQCMYLHKVKECDCLAQKLSKQTESVSTKVKNDTVCNEKASNVFRKEREQYFEIQDLKAKLQDKNIAISELKKFIEHGKAKSVDTKFDRPSVVRQPNAQRILKPSVLGKPTPFLNSLDRIYFQKTRSVPKANVSEGLSKPVTAQNLSQTTKKAIIQLILFIVDSGCTKHMTGNLKLLCNFVEKFLETIHFGNDQFAPILGYGDLVQGNVTINRVYYVECLNHNLFSVGQFCDADLEVAFRKSTCFIRDFKVTIYSSVIMDLISIHFLFKNQLHQLLMAKATPTQAWLWHRRLSHLNFDYINLLSKKDIVIGLPKLKYIKDQLCSSCELSKAKRSSFKSKVVPSSKGRLNLLHMDLCGPMRVASINGKKYILVIVDDYSRYTWTLFLHSKDETPEVGTEFLNKTLNAFFKEEGIEHQTSTARTPEQNGVVERQNHTLVEASDYDNPDPVPQRQDVYSSADADVPSQEELDMLFGPLYDEFFNTGSNPSTNIQSTSAPSTHTNMHAEENNNEGYVIP
nr:hypothetical protein [Tanacetum cinerariifolium]